MTLYTLADLSIIIEVKVKCCKRIQCGTIALKPISCWKLSNRRRMSRMDYRTARAIASPILATDIVEVAVAAKQERCLQCNLLINCCTPNVGLPAAIQRLFVHYCLLFDVGLSGDYSFML